MKVLEILAEGTGFCLYIENPYGHGLDPDPVKNGEVLPDKDGGEAEFCGITPDGKKVIVKINGEQKNVSPEFVAGKIFAVGETPK